MERVPKDFNELLEGINIIKKDKEHDWMSAIIEYCEINEYRIEDVGFMIKEQKNFLKIVSDDFKRNKYIKDENDTKELIDLFSEWS